MNRNGDDEDSLLRSVALQNAKAILQARQRTERELIDTREELRESAERLQVALEAGQLGYWSVDTRTDVVTLTAYAAEIFGVPQDVPLTGAELTALLHEDDREGAKAVIDRALADRKDYHVEFRVLHRQGGVRWVSSKGRGTFGPDGQVIGMLGIVQDRTQRRRVEEALRESEERLRATFSQAAVGFAVAGLDGRFLELNRKFCDIVGFSDDELRTRTFTEITHPEDHGETMVQIGRLIAGEVDVISLEKRYIRKDGGVVWSLTSVTLLKDACGRPRHFIGVIEEITQRKWAEEALREETRLLEILNRTGAAIASELDLMALLQAVTDAATELSGAKFGAFFYNVVGKDGESFKLLSLSGAPLAAFARFGFPRNTPIFSPTFRGDSVVRSADILLDPRYGKMGPHFGMPEGHVPVRSYLAVPVVSRSREVIGGLFLGHPDPDVFSERAERLVVGVAAQAAIGIDNARLYEASKNAAEERKWLLESEQEARAQAERMSELKDQFLATLSHELRTPMGAILGWVQVIGSRRMSEPELARALEVIERNARSQARLIEDMLDIARITSGQVRLEVQNFELAGVIDAALETVRPAAEAKAIQLERQVEGDVGLIVGDPSRLQQVIWNLLSNSIKFTPKGGRVVLASRRTDAEMELTVADTGIGIRPEFLPFVFDRFRQADGSPTRRHGGLGLGLAITKHLVELHGGSVRVESEGEGHGASFTVHLPMTRSLPVEEAQATARAALPKVTILPSPTMDLSGARILVVDDESDARELIKRVLEDCGAEVVTAASAADALALARRERFQLIVADIAMPVMDGYDLLRRLRALGPEHDGGMPAIAVTALARSEDRTRALRAGFRMHLAKPLEPTELVVSVASALGRLGA